MSSILVTPDFEHTVKRYPVSWFSWTLNIKWYIRASWPTRKKLQPSSSPKSPSSSRISGQRTPTCGSFMQRQPSESTDRTVNNQIRPHRTETSPEDYGLGTRPDHGFCCLLRNPLRGFKGQTCLLIYSITLAEGFQTNSSPWAGRPTPYCSHGRHVGPPPRGRETRLPVPRFISGEVAPRDEGPSSLQGIQKP